MVTKSIRWPLLLVFLSLSAKANVLYTKNIFSHIHQNLSRYSASMTTLGCGHPVKVLRKITSNSEIWLKVKSGPAEGYMMIKDLGEKNPDCFQEAYPKFYNSVNLDVTEMYYWGRLNDQYVKGRSRVR